MFRVLLFVVLSCPWLLLGAPALAQGRERAREFPPELQQLLRTNPGDPESGALSMEEVLEDLAVLEDALESRMGLLERRGEDWRLALDAVAFGLSTCEPEERTRGAFALALQLALSRLGDAHTRVGAVSTYCIQTFAPFLVEETAGGVVAFREGRGGLIDDAFPFLAALDGLPLQQWLEESVAIVPPASAYFQRCQALKNLRYLGQLRADAGRTSAEPVVLTLCNAEGQTIERRLPLVTDHRPTYRPWPREPSGLLAGDPAIAYVRLPLMDGRARGMRELRQALKDARGAAGLILDLRMNGGGTLEPLNVLLPALLPKGQAALVAAAGVERTEIEGGAAPVLASFGFRSAEDPDLSPAARRAAREFLEGFRPAWRPAASCSALQLYLVERRAVPDALRFEGPVVVLTDGLVYAAADVLVAALATLPQVTVIGTPTGGGFGKPEAVALPRSKMHVIVSPLVTYRPDGALHVGPGQQPDQLVWPAAADTVGASDRVLDAALELLRN